MGVTNRLIFISATAAGGLSSAQPVWRSARWSTGGRASNGDVPFTIRATESLAMIRLMMVCFVPLDSPVALRL